MFFDVKFKRKVLFRIWSRPSTIPKFINKNVPCHQTGLYIRCIPRNVYQNRTLIIFFCALKSLFNFMSGMKPQTFMP